LPVRRRGRHPELPLNKKTKYLTSSAASTESSSRHANSWERRYHELVSFCSPWRVKMLSYDYIYSFLSFLISSSSSSNMGIAMYHRATHRIPALESGWIRLVVFCLLYIFRHHFFVVWQNSCALVNTPATHGT
jgi:hypothetical protein